MAKPIWMTPFSATYSLATVFVTAASYGIYYIHESIIILFALFGNRCIISYINESHAQQRSSIYL